MKRVTPNLRPTYSLSDRFNDLFGKYTSFDDFIAEARSEDEIRFTTGLIADLQDARAKFPHLTKELNHLISLLEELL